MSLKLLLDNLRKPWLIGRMEDLTLDGDLIVNGDVIHNGNLTVTGQINCDDIVSRTMGGNLRLNTNGSAMIQCNKTLTSNTDTNFIISPDGVGICVIGKLTQINPTLQVENVESLSDGQNLILRGQGAGVVEITDALILPTSGGTQGQLNYYEESYTSSSNTWTGPGASAVSSQYIITQIGNIVTLHLPDITQASANNLSATSTEAIPSRFRSVQDKRYNFMVLNNSNIQLGQLHINMFNGIMTLSPIDPATNTPTPYAATNNWGIISSGFSWLTV